MKQEELSSTATHAIGYIKKGFAVVPIPHGEKGPIISGWQNSEITEETVSAYFPEEGNLGLRNGTPSSNRGDVDLDCSEVLAIADLFLPETKMIHGRVTKARSHFWYELTGELPKKTIQFQDVPDSQNKKSVMLVEFRWDGSQTLVPPSVHPSGEELRWESAGRPSLVDATELLQRVKILAAAALIARHWPIGARQDTALALSGALLRQGWRTDTVEAFVSAACTAASDEEVEKRCQAVQDTADKLAAGEQVTGLPRLSELIGKAVVARLSKWLELKTETAPHIRDSIGGDRPQVQTNNRQLRDIVADTKQAIVAKNDPPRLFLRSGQLVEVRKNKEGLLSIVEMDSYSLRNVANDAADFVSVSGEGDDTKVRHTKPPMDAMTSLLAHPESITGLPPLRGVVMSPVLSSEGVLETNQGYLRSAQLYYEPPEGQLDLMLSKPTLAEVRRALADLFDYLMHGFPFVDYASKANTLAAILLPFVRPYIKGPTPLYLINASTPATGKSLLAELIGTISAPGNIVPTPAPSTEDEWRKKITAALRAGPPFIWFDNLEGKVQSESLCVALTGTQWADRQLGSSTELRLPIHCTWLATANNARLHKDVVSRSVLIYLDAGMEHPEERNNFKVENPIAEVRNNRARWLEAVLVLIRYWLDQGAPTFSGKGISRFPAWSRTIGGILESIGVPGFLENVAELAQGADPEHEAWRAFVETWGQKHGTKHVKASHELYDLAFGSVDYDGKPMTDGILTDYIEAENHQKKTARLGIALKSRRGRVYGCWKVMSQPGKTTIHYLEPVTGSVNPTAGVAEVSPLGTPVQKPLHQAPKMADKQDLDAEETPLLPEDQAASPEPPHENRDTKKVPAPDWGDELRQL